jgi:hypothetical protein
MAQMLVSLFVLLAITTLTQATDTPECVVSYENHNQTDYGPLRLPAFQGVVLDFASVPVSHVCLGLFDDKEHSIVATTTSSEDGTSASEISLAGDIALW